jgi:hypothetical protein
MNAFKYFYLALLIILIYNSSLKAWTSSNEGVCYTMDTLCLLTDDIIYNIVDEMYEVDCDIFILENDTLEILSGQTVKFLSESWPGPTVRYQITIFGCILALGSEANPITLGDPNCTYSGGERWAGILFYNTSQNGESKLQYCNLKGATNDEPYLETAIYCENSSPIIDHCEIKYMGSGEMTGGCCAIGLKYESFPIISYCSFNYISNGVAIWSNMYGYQDSINGPNPLIYGCNITGVSGFYGYGTDHDYIVLWGGFLDNCYFWNSYYNVPDTTLGYPVDTIGDGIKTSTSTQPKGRFLLVDGVVHPRNEPLLTGTNEEETDILPTTTNFLILKNNYPNPFSGFTTIEFEVKSNTVPVSLEIFDSKGNKVRDLISSKKYNAGKYTIDWHGDNDSGHKANAGIYFYKLTSGDKMLVKKAIVVK